MSGRIPPHRNASGYIPTRPNASEWVRTRSKSFENVEKQRTVLSPAAGLGTKAIGAIRIGGGEAIEPGESFKLHGIESGAKLSVEIQMVPEGFVQPE